MKKKKYIQKDEGKKGKEDEINVENMNEEQILKRIPVIWLLEGLHENESLGNYPLKMIQD